MSERSERMNALTLGGGAAASITSIQIAYLIGSRHDSVKRTIERLVEQGVIVQPPLVDEPGEDSMGRPRSTQVYQFSGERGKRDSIVAVAQLSPEFTARLVDRWQELEAKLAQPQFSIPQTMPEALRLAADLAEEKAALEATVAEQAPKVAALERFADHEGKHNTRNSAKILGVRERQLITWLLACDWYYRDHAGRLCAKADKIAAGHLDTLTVEIRRSDGIQLVPQPVVTQKGLARLAVLLAKSGLLPRKDAA